MNLAQGRVVQKRHLGIIRMFLLELLLITMSRNIRCHVCRIARIDRTDVIVRPRFLISLRFLQLTHLAYAANPSTHVFLGVRRQIVRSRGSFHVEHVRIFLLLPVQPQSGVHLFALVQIDDSLQLPALAVRVVLQHILTRQLALLQSEPTTSPSLIKCKTETQEEEQF